MSDEMTPAEWAVYDALPADCRYMYIARTVAAAALPHMFREAADYIDLTLPTPTGCGQCEDPVEALKARADEMEKE